MSRKISWLCPSCEHYVLDTCTGATNACEDYKTMEVLPEYFDKPKTKRKHYE